MKTVFIILHYQSIEDTLNCINSIQAMDSQDDLGIIIIDNASPNGSGQVLAEKYSSISNIRVILHDYNCGFSHANNIGCELARKEWNPEYYVVANNDIIFTQSDFPAILDSKYKEKPFYILGPDIYNLRTGKHQSPMGTSAPTRERAQTTVRLNTIALSLYAITSPLMKLWFKRLNTNASDAALYDQEQTNVYLQGACVIFSRDYIEERGAAYSPETFFFSEEAIFTRWCEINQKAILYTPALRVQHNESASTLSDKDVKRRMRFQMQNILDSTKIYLETFYK